MTKKLSVRERQVMIGIASGLYIKEIADQLGICSKWVERCRARVFKKLKLPGRVQLTHYALAHGYVKNIYGHQT